MICLMLSQVRLSVAGSCAMAFQKLLIQSTLRVAMMSSYTARTSGLASLYSINLNVAIAYPRESLMPAHQTVAGTARRKPAAELCHVVSWGRLEPMRKFAV